MIRLCALLLIMMLPGCKGVEPADFRDGDIISLEVLNSLSIPSHRVKVVLDADGNLERELEDRGEQPKTSKHRVGADDIKRVRDLIRSIDWHHVSKDVVIGLDGTSARVEYQGSKYSVWTPRHDTEKRGLTNFLRLENELFRLAGFNDPDTPQQ